MVSSKTKGAFNIIEIKAKCNNPLRIRKFLAKNARSIGKDRQVDTYFNVSKGRLKLREGRIENNLIFYLRKNKRGPKKSEVILYNCKKNSVIKDMLLKTLGKFVEVCKEREIFFIKNVKFHIDYVKGLGSFIEIEAIDKKGTLSVKKLREQIDYYLEKLNITKNSLISDSYSDLLIKKKFNT